jgi:hypothetical protein
MQARGENPGSQRAAGRAVSEERGGARLRLLVFLIVVFVLGYGGYKVLPPFYNNYLLQDWLNQQVPQMMGRYQGNEDALKAVVQKEMDTDGIPATADNIHILQDDANGLSLEIDYDVPVDLDVYQLRLHFSPSYNSQSLVQTDRK